ncbi:MAG: hypothetical protein ACI8S6_003035 [Myxococcota bacterium]|jgi:hypothetical protein
MTRSIVALVALGLGCNGDQENNITRLTPDIIVAPGEVDFGGVVVLYDAEQTIQLSNAGRAPLVVSSIYVDGDPDGVYTITPTSIDELPVDESIGVGIFFEPGTYISYDADLVIESNDPDTPEYRVPITAEGIDGPIPDISLSPASLDFGTIANGITTTALFYINNDGDGPLIIDSIEQSGSGNFAITQNISGAKIGPDNYFPVEVRYTPTQDAGDNGTITITSNDPDEGEIDLVLLGNGGGDFEYPVADIDCPEQVAPPVRLSLDGSGSYDPSDLEPLTYTWSLDETPNGATVEIDNDVADIASLFVNLSGSWQVSLKVTNDIGLTSAPAVCAFEAIPDDLIQVELTWDSGDSDFDLHFIQGDNEMFLAPGDCCYCNPNPNWGASGNSDDPDLSLDNRVGYGPEVTTLLEPDDGDYYVKVHYYGDNGGGTSIATVRVFINGVQEHEESTTMEHNDTWDVGYIRWPAAVFVEQDNTLYNPDTRACYYE